MTNVPGSGTSNVASEKPIVGGEQQGEAFVENKLAEDAYNYSNRDSKYTNSRNTGEFETADIHLPGLKIGDNDKKLEFLGKEPPVHNEIATEKQEDLLQNPIESPKKEPLKELLEQFELRKLERELNKELSSGSITDIQQVLGNVESAQDYLRLQKAVESLRQHSGLDIDLTRMSDGKPTLEITNKGRLDTNIITITEDSALGEVFSRGFNPYYKKDPAMALRQFQEKNFSK